MRYFIFRYFDTSFINIILSILYYQYYIQIFPISSRCNADVGRRGDKQIISLGDGCLHKSVVVHEIGHVIGFWHEQNRPDRDEHVTIYTDNIMDGKKEEDFYGIPMDFRDYSFRATSFFYINFRYRVYVTLTFVFYFSVFVWRVDFF